MYGPPRLMPSDLDELVCRVGGARQAARLLGITPEIVADWDRSDGAPQMALRLLWYAGPDGRAAALLDTENELRAVTAERDALGPARGVAGTQAQGVLVWRRHFTVGLAPGGHDA